MNKLSYGILCLALIAVAADKEKDGSRKLSSPEENPGCTIEPECNKPWLVDVSAVGDDDLIHYLWSVVGAPTYMMAIANSSAQLDITWKDFFKFQQASVRFTNPDDVNYVFGFSITQLILFDDKDDTGKIDDYSEDLRREVPMKDFDWEIKEVINKTEEKSGVLFETVNYKNEALPDKTKISFKVLAFGEEGRSPDLPHLITTPDSAQLEIILDHLVLNITEKGGVAPLANFTHPRWALELFIFSMEDRSDIKKGFAHKTHKSLDDENTPGVFNIDEITTNSSRSGGNGGFMQWRPVSYLTSDRDITHSTYPNINTTFPEVVVLDLIKESLAYATFGDQLATHMVTTKTTVSFGQSKDDFYTKFNYTSWALSYGVGSPPEETFSTMVIIIISLGIGIPAVVFLIGGIFICIRNSRR